MITVIAQKSTRYRSKLYRKGKRFEVPPQTARLYGALGRARLAAEAELGDPLPSRMPQDRPPAAPMPPRDAGPDPLAHLREEYEGITGLAPDKRWGEARLRTEIRDRRDRRIAGEDPEGADGLGPDTPGELL